MDNIDLVHNILHYTTPLDNSYLTFYDGISYSINILRGIHSDIELILMHSDIPEWMDYNEGIVSGTPGNSDIGLTNITGVIIGPEGVSVEVIMVVEVINMNSPPWFLPVSNISITLPQPINTTVTAIDDDPTVNIISYSLVEENNWLSYKDRDGILEVYGIPPDSLVGEYTLSIQASDHFGASSIIDIHITILPEPIIPDIPMFLTDPSIVETQQFIVKWYPAPHASGYHLYEDGDMIMNGTNTSIILSREDGVYTYRVSGWNKNGSSAMSGSLSLNVIWNQTEWLRWNNTQNNITEWYAWNTTQQNWTEWEDWNQTHQIDDNAIDDDSDDDSASIPMVGPMGIAVSITIAMYVGRRQRHHCREGQTKNR